MTTHDYARKLLALPEIRAISMEDNGDPSEPEIEQAVRHDHPRFEYPEGATREEKDRIRNIWLREAPKESVIRIG